MIHTATSDVPNNTGQTGRQYQFKSSLNRSKTVKTTSTMIHKNKIMDEEEYNTLLNAPSSLLDYFTFGEVKFRWRLFKNLFKRKANASSGFNYYPRHDKSISVTVVRVTDYSVEFKKTGSNSISTRSRQGFEKSYLRVKT